MRYLFGFLCVCALGVMPLLGCSETAGDGGSGGSAGAGGDGGGGGTGETVQLLMVIVENEDWHLGPALEGVEVCETDTTNCVTTGADGRATLTLPANQAISYTMAKDGYMTRLFADVTDETFNIRPFFTWPMFRDDEIEDLAASVMIPYPLTEGWIAMQAFNTGSQDPFHTQGVTHELVDGTATQYYTDESGQPTLGLSATTSTGQGGFFEVTPGEHQVEFGGTVTNCQTSIAWPGDAPNRVKVPVRVGVLTFADVICDLL